jgi:Flp pilus assembly protein TadG
VSVLKQAPARTRFARTVRSLWRNREGSALVEATVVVPVLFTLTFGVYEFSWVFYNQQLVSSGIRDAVRYASKAASPCDGTITTDVQNLATTGTIDGTGAARVMGWSAGSVTVGCVNIDNTAGTYRGGNSITIVTVSTSFTDSSLGFFPYLGLMAPTISVSHSERAIQDTPAF